MNNELFNKALPFVLNQEGGFVNDPDDKGGATNKGVTQGTYDAYRKAHKQPIQTVKNITDTEVSDIYYNNYWLKAGCDKMTPIFAVISFDTAVNMGIGRVQEFMHAAEYTSIDKFLLARIGKYVEFAQNKTQAKFLLGWLNRVFRLIDFVKTIKIRVEENV